MKLLHPVSLAVAVALGGASYLAYQNAQPSMYEQKADYLAAKAEKKANSPKRYDKPKEAQEFYISQRLPKGAETLPTEKYSKALAHIKTMQRYSLADSKVVFDYTPRMNSFDGINRELGQWEELGPGNIGGRTRTLIIHPTEHDIMYTAGVAGGVWKTTDAGQSWQPLSDLATNLAVTTLTFAPNDPNTIYAGTGEGFFNADAIRGDGIFRSTDGGATWEQLEATASNELFHYTNKIVFSKNDPATLYAATRGGVQRSKDSGVSWETVFVAEGAAVGCTDLTLVDDGDKDVLVTACGSFDTGGIHRSADSGDSWATVLAVPNQGRSTIAAAPSDSNIMYALLANINDHGMEAVYKSEDMGLTWNTTVTRDSADAYSRLLLSNTVYGLFPQCGYGPEPQYYNQGWYDNIIAVDPVNPDVVWTGGIDLFRSDDGGQSFVPTSIWWFDMTHPLYAHADQHTLVFHPAYDGVNNTTLFAGNDGGIQRTDNALDARLDLSQVCGATNDPTGKVNWQTLNNGYAVTQFYHGTVMPDGTAYFGGTQDNGTLLGSDGGFNEWREITGGDGGWTAVDPTNPDVMFSEYTRLSLQKSTDGGVTFANSVNGITGDGFPFITRFEMAPSNPQVLWIGGAQLWRTTDQAENWVAGSPVLDSSVYAIGIAPQDENIVAAGTREGYIYINYAAGAADAEQPWHSFKIGAEDERATISAIAFDPSDAQIAYATVSTFDQAHVWKTTDGGKSWLPIDKDIPNVPATSVAVDPNNPQRVIIGTDLGVFISVDGGENWFADGSGLANTNIAKVAFHNNEVFAFTHGRSAYKVPLATFGKVELNTLEDTELSVTPAFVSRFSKEAFATVEIIVAPESGALMLEGDVLTAGSVVAADKFAQVVYLPHADYSGEDNFTLNGTPEGSDVAEEVMVDLTIEAVNDAPVFDELDDIILTLGDKIGMNFNDKVSDVDSESIKLSMEPKISGLTLVNGVLIGTAEEAFSGDVKLIASDGEAETTTSFVIDIAERAPVIELQQRFEVFENTAVGTIIGQLAFSDPDADVSPVTAFHVYGDDSFTIDVEGNITVARELDFEYQELAVLGVQAEDTFGHMSKHTTVNVKIKDLRGDDDDDNDGDSGSFSWLALLSLPLAMLRRRRK
ncbi:rhombosortase-dependent cadherin domain-containing protein [Pseudoalteromonas sp. OOF1S-7]|uniref:rhombosortase-dependent cadherin domain-containing protein n=1 Tax=Pseudoalteromonas sp. OOF1S-7 TaxID=2917757 RepID=UPI001EF5B7F8|nr:rhombosortase-dependent cadherin domain-containing protein [Pseudoalteromonas sp. OOF1S-7]MCG7534006.1 rhombosortase-dependent cadherin domain-containing protein [Pseudoalteromonas sp. OOF1S-7]